MVGVSWLMLSSPENASHAAENPTSSAELEMPSPLLHLLSTVDHCAPCVVKIATTLTTRLTTNDAMAMTSATIALSRMPMMLISRARRARAPAMSLDVGIEPRKDRCRYTGTR